MTMFRAPSRWVLSSWLTSTSPSAAIRPVPRYGSAPASRGPFSWQLAAGLGRWRVAGRSLRSRLEEREGGGDGEVEAGGRAAHGVRARPAGGIVPRGGQPAGLAAEDEGDRPAEIGVTVGLRGVDARGN